MAVAGGTVSAAVVKKTDATALQGFVKGRMASDTQVFTDDASAYKGIGRPHEAMKRSVGECVRHMAHTNGLGGFWASMWRGYEGVYRKIAPKHLDRYVSEFSDRHNNRPKDTIKQMADVVGEMVGKWLRYVDLIADSGLYSGAWS